MEQNKYSIYNQSQDYPKLSLQDASLAIKAYLKYKSSRCCGLSGLLGLNGLFTSYASHNTIKILKNSKMTDSARFASAANFITQNKNTHFAKFLQKFVTDSRQVHESQWTKEATHGTEFTMK